MDVDLDVKAFAAILNTLFSSSGESVVVYFAFSNKRLPQKSLALQQPKRYKDLGKDAIPSVIFNGDLFAKLNFAFALG